MAVVKKSFLLMVGAMLILVFVSCRPEAKTQTEAGPVIHGETILGAHASDAADARGGGQMDTEDGSDGTTADSSASSGRIVLAGPKQDAVCTVTYPAADRELKDAADGLADYVNALVPGARLTAAGDSEGVSTAYEIAITAPEPALPFYYALHQEGRRITIRCKDSEAAGDAVRYLKAYCVADGYFAVEEGFAFSSGAGPQVLSQSPEKYYCYEDIYTPTLVYTFDAGAVDASASRLLVGGRDVTQYAVWSDGSVTLSGYEVDPGDHTVLLALAGSTGDVKVFETTFSCADDSVMHLYAGEVHAHTSDSDGQGTVQEAYAYARDVAGLDYFAVTDHSGYLAENGAYHNSQIPNADSFNEPGRFAALYGYEQTYSINTGYYGHLNTLNSSSLTTWELSLQEYYELMAQDEEAVVQFNHPGYSWGNFLEYDCLSPELDAVIDLIEVKSRSAAEQEYPLALTKGWHVSPVFNEDNHLPDWGTVSEACGYVLAPALTRQNIIDAFRKNRTYTTSDPTLHVYYQVNGEWMGSRLDDPDQLHFTVRLSTENTSGLGVVSILAEDGIVVATRQIGAEKEYTLEMDLPPLYDYYYVKVESDSAWCYTAPVWIENREQLTIDAMDHDLVLKGKDCHRAYATLTNHTDRAMTDVAVDFYLAPRSGFSLGDAEPYETVKVGDLAAGETAVVSADVRYDKVSVPRIYAVAKGVQNGREYGAVEYTEISILYITEILPYTCDSDAFEFIELYNNSNSVLDLSRCGMHYYARAGLKQSDLEENAWTLNGKIQPHSVMVLWRVSLENTLTVADFNKHFGTDLVEGRDIVMFTGKHIPHKKPVQLELCMGSTVLERIWYNWNKAEDVLRDHAITFRYPDDHTMTAKVERSRMQPTPGVLTEGQVPGIARAN